MSAKETSKRNGSVTSTTSTVDDERKILQEQRKQQFRVHLFLRGISLIDAFLKPVNAYLNGILLRKLYDVAFPGSACGK